jgi:hypothetical protein
MLETITTKVIVVNNYNTADISLYFLSLDWVAVAGVERNK